MLVVGVYKYKWCPQSYNHEKKDKKKCNIKRKKECASAASSILQNFGLHLCKKRDVSIFRTHKHIYNGDLSAFV